LPKFNNLYFGDVTFGDVTFGGVTFGEEHTYRQVTEKEHGDLL
jgi:hypothetical protein